MCALEKCLERYQTLVGGALGGAGAVLAAFVLNSEIGRVSESVAGLQDRQENIRLGQPATPGSSDDDDDWEVSVSNEGTRSGTLDRVITVVVMARNGQDQSEIISYIRPAGGERVMTLSPEQGGLFLVRIPELPEDAQDCFLEFRVLRPDEPRDGRSLTFDCGDWEVVD